MWLACAGGEAGARQPRLGRDGVKTAAKSDCPKKTIAMGAPIIAAVSAPTALAVRACAAAGITLVAIARDDGFEIFSHQERVGPDHVPIAKNRVLQRVSNDAPKFCQRNE